MKVILTLALGILLCSPLALLGQTVSADEYKRWSDNKNRSIFKSANKGDFTGTCYGFLELLQDQNTTILDFQNTNTTLHITPDPDEVYDNSTKLYSTATTSGKTTVTYETYALANILTIHFNGTAYQVGIIDGACDMLIKGLSFHYCPEKPTEYLSLYVTKPFELTNTRELMDVKKMNYQDAKKTAKTIILQSGSTLIFTLKKQ